MVASESRGSKFDVETSFYRADATWHDIVFFHASASGLATVLLILVLKGRILFPGTESFFGIVSPIAIFVISIILLLAAFYFFAISITKLGTTLVRTQVEGHEIKTAYAIVVSATYFLFFVILALILH